MKENVRNLSKELEEKTENSEDLLMNIMSYG